MLSFELNERLVQKLSVLQNLFTDRYVFLSSLREDEREALRHYARISMIGSSTRIENAQLTDSEVNWMDTILTADGKVSAFESYEYAIKDKLSKDRERSIEEVAGCRQLLSLI